MLWDQDRIARVLQRVDALDEQDGLLRNSSVGFHRVLAIVESDAEDLAWHDRCQQFDHIGSIGGDAMGAEHIANYSEYAAVRLLAAIMGLPGFISVMNDFHF